MTDDKTKFYVGNDVFDAIYIFSKSQIGLNNLGLFFLCCSKMIIVEWTYLLLFKIIHFRVETFSSFLLHF